MINNFSLEVFILVMDIFMSITFYFFLISSSQFVKVMLLYIIRMIGEGLSEEEIVIDH